MGIKLQKKRWIEVAPELYGNILVGLSFLALTFLTVKIFAPDISSNADTNNASVEAGPYTMSISTDSLTSINITPTASQAVYTGTSAISYTNTCPHGFNVAMSSVSDNTSLTRSGSDSGAKEIPTISSGAALTDNTWGFSKDNGSTYNAIPALANPATIIDTTSATTTSTTLNLIYGVKADNSLPSGSYTNDLVYTVSAKPQCLAYTITWNLDGGTVATDATYPSSQSYGSTLDLTSLTPTKEGYEFTGWSNGTNTFDGTETAADINPTNFPSLTMTAQWEQVLPMQDFSCSALTNVGDSVKLRDTRDDNIYTVKKLADGNCWMTDNLRLIDKTISSTDSNLPSGETYTVPASDLSSFTYSYNTNSAYLDSTHGGYYNFYIATAGWGTDSLESSNSPKDICPKGWRLPTGGPSGEFQTLYNNYNSDSLMMDALNLTPSGYVLNGSMHNQGSEGFFWSSAVYNANYAYNLDLTSSSVYLTSKDNKAKGFSVRCVAKDPEETVDRTISDITYMQDITSKIAKNTPIGAVATLTDIRDNNTYTVRKLKDGKIWMTQNLRLIDKTISSADSNLPSGETYTVPASDASAFTPSNYITNAAYLDTTYGAYYNFYTATAGDGGIGLKRGNVPSSICPKGWRLPVGEPPADFNALYNNYKSAALMMDVPNFTLSGGVMPNGSVSNQGSYGYFWSSSVDINYDYKAYFMYLNSSDVVPLESADKFVGFSVRCVAEDRTISDITYMQDMTSKIIENTPIDTVATLTDIRDNNTYTVRKLKDGKVWMTENLRLIDKTITSADSNVSSDFTIPASSASGFNEEDANNAYIDSTYGGYYTFYTATAGWGTTSVTSGNSPNSVCPKGWRLPTGGSSGEFQTLYNNYNSPALMQGDPKFTLSGFAGDGSVYQQGSYGRFWSSKVSNANNAYDLYLDSSVVYPSYDLDKKHGLPVRCVAI